MHNDQSDQSNWHTHHLKCLLFVFVDNIQNLLFLLFGNSQLIAVNYSYPTVLWSYSSYMTALLCPLTLFFPPPLFHYDSNVLVKA